MIDRNMDGQTLVIEEDGIDDLTGPVGEVEGNIQDPKGSLDIRDLLLDETD